MTINKAHLTATADNQSRLYGQANPTLSETITGFVNGENTSTAGITGTATGSTTATAATGVGIATITGSTGTLVAANYDFIPADGTVTITRRPVNVTAYAQSKTVGSEDPVLTYQTEAQTAARGLLQNETLTGSLERTGGETLGSYAITQGTLTNVNNGNYAISFIGNALTINSVPLVLPYLTPTPVPVVSPVMAPVQPPVVTGGAVELVTPSGVMPVISQTAVAPMVVEPAFVTLPIGKIVTAATTSLSGGFVDAKPLTVALVETTAFITPLPQNIFTHSDARATILLAVRMADGTALPVWMTFDPGKRVITGTPPKGVTGEFNVVVIASDQFGGEAHAEMKVVVGK